MKKNLLLILAASTMLLGACKSTNDAKKNDPEDLEVYKVSKADLENIEKITKYKTTATIDSSTTATSTAFESVVKTQVTGEFDGTHTKAVNSETSIIRFNRKTITDFLTTNMMETNDANIKLVVDYYKTEFEQLGYNTLKDDAQNCIYEFSKSYNSQIQYIEITSDPNIVNVYCTDSIWGGPEIGNIPVNRRHQELSNFNSPSVISAKFSKEFLDNARFDENEKCYVCNKWEYTPLANMGASPSIELTNFVFKASFKNKVPVKMVGSYSVEAYGRTNSVQLSVNFDLFGENFNVSIPYDQYEHHDCHGDHNVNQSGADKETHYFRCDDCGDIVSYGPHEFDEQGFCKCNYENVEASNLICEGHEIALTLIKNLTTNKITRVQYNGVMGGIMLDEPYLGIYTSVGRADIPDDFFGTITFLEYIGNTGDNIIRRYEFYVNYELDNQRQIHEPIEVISAW